jgi:hypothetical protein
MAALGSASKAACLGHRYCVLELPQGERVRVHMKGADYHQYRNIVLAAMKRFGFSEYRCSA